MRKHVILIHALLFLIIPAMNGLAKQKVIFIVNNDFYSQHGYMVDSYKNDVEQLDNRKVEVIPWTQGTGTNIELCIPIFQRLQSEYAVAINAGDALEGAVLIGDVPVPLFLTPPPPPNPPTWNNYHPIDQVYMDIVDASGQPYTASPYYDPSVIVDCYTSSYTFPPGDRIYDIWVSRINASYLSGLREGMNVYDEYSIIARYLNRVSLRMNYPASIPSRGFAMGGPQDLGDLHSVLGQTMVSLKLPWLAEYTGGHNSPFNWMSQLLAGPRGCVNYGAFNGTLFAAEANRRYCRYSQLPVVYFPNNPNPTNNYPIPNYPSDSLGWEWAGLYDHSDRGHTNFFSNEGWGLNFQGRFTFGTYGPFWGMDYRTSGGYLDGYYYYQDNEFNPNPTGNGFGWKDKWAEWRWPVTSNKTYDVYMYYDAPCMPSWPYGANCDNVHINLYRVTLSGSLPNGITTDGHFIESVNQQIHTDFLSGDCKWEKVFSDVELNVGQMAIFIMSANDGQYGNHIADAIRFISTDQSVDIIIDDLEQAIDGGSDNNPTGIFTTRGFFTSDHMNRAYEDMGSEPGGGGLSKTQFFLMTACEINNFIYTNTIQNKNHGNLYALGHNGLLCMGTSTLDRTSYSKQPYVTAVQAGKNFGQAFIEQSNSAFFNGEPAYSLLGAGTLRARPYVQFRSDVFARRVIGDAQEETTVNPVLIRDVTVNGSGSWTVTSTHNTSSSPFGTYSEIVVRSETIFSPTGTNEVRLVAN